MHDDLPFLYHQDDLRIFIAQFRDYLTPTWISIHHSDLAWKRSLEMPYLASQAMCRHACAFLKRIALDADRRHKPSSRSISSRWQVVKGFASPARLPMTPRYLERDPTHFVACLDSKFIVDPTADQFGLDPLAIHSWKDMFDAEPIPTDPGLAASARAWSRQSGYDDLVDRIITL